MRVSALRTPVVHAGDDLHRVLEEALPQRLPERCIVAVTSKVVALCEGRVEQPAHSTRHELIAREAEVVLEANEQLPHLPLTVAQGRLVPAAGIDESNADGQLVLWPSQPQASADGLWRFLRERYGVSEAGVVLTDSTTTPLRRGTTGMALAHSGFQALRGYVGEPDLFGRPLAVTSANLAEGVAAAAVLVMGEGAEQTPVALVEGLDAVVFASHAPSADELADLRIDPVDDLYAPLLQPLLARGRQR